MKPNFALFSENLDYALGWTVIHSLWQATLIALISGILMIVLRKKTAKIRYMLANVALLSVLVVAIVTFCFYYDFSKAEGTLSFTPSDMTQNAVLTPTTEGVVTPAVSTVATPKIMSLEGFKDYFNRNLPLILIMWVLGVTVFMLRLLGGLSYIYYLKSRMNFPADEYWVEMIENLSKKAGLNQGVELVESAMVRTPMVVGHLKPMILFPMGVINRLSPEEVEAILAHELAHVLRKDYIFNILQSVIEALFYYHPAVWWLSSQIGNERESACDEIAINLIQSKMNYARALVAIQEMAYFPMTPALAFAGQRKSQFLIRMQRILNQPNNKTNVMEKLTATCILIFLIIGLSFANNLKNDDIPLSINQNSPALDTIPMATIDGDYNYEDNIQKVKMSVKDGKISSLVVNGVKIAESDIPNFEKLTNKILRKNQATVTNKQPIYPSVIKKPGQEIRLDNLTEMIDIDKMGGADAVFSEANDGSMKIKGKDGSVVTIEHGDDDSQVVTTTDRYGNVSKVITDKNGVTRTEQYDNRGNLKEKSIISTTSSGHSSVITEDSYGNSNSIKSNNRGNTTIESHQNGKVSKTFIDGDVVTTVDDDGSKNIFDKDKNGNSIVKRYDKRGNFVETITFIDEKAYVNGRELSAAELRDRGFTKNMYGSGFSRNGGYNNITPPKNNSSRRTQTNYNNSADDEEDLEGLIEEFRQEVKNLRQEIKECECQSNFKFRMGLIEELDRLFPAYKSQNLNVFHAFEKRFLKIKNDWESGECDDHKPKNGTGYNYNYNQGENNRVSQTSDGYYSYGTGTTKSDARKAQRDAEKRLKESQSKNNSNREDRANNSVFLNLLNMGYIQENVKCSFYFNKNSIIVNGKRLENSVFDTIKRDFEAKLGKRIAQVTINFNGVVSRSNDNDELNTSGSYSTSLSTEN